MHILLTANGSPWTRNKGGGTLAVHHLASALTERGHAVTVVYGRRPGDSSAPPVPYSIEWAHFFEVATINLNIFSFYKKAKQLLGENRYDLVHSNAEEGFFVPALCRQNRIPFVYTSHANYLPSHGMAKGVWQPIRFLKSVNAYLERGTASQADLIFTFSEFSKNLVETSLGEQVQQRVRVVSPGVESQWFDVERKAAFKKRILFWGRMAEQKGVAQLLEAFKKVRQEYGDVDLCLVGGGSCQSQYEALAQRLGIAEFVTFAGWLGAETIQQMAAESLVGVFPSRVESFGLAIAEAMATGLPVVATCAGALPEFIEDQVTGLLVDRDDTGSLSDAIIFALRNPAEMEQMGGNAKSRIREKCSWRKAAKIVEDEYNLALGLHLK